MLDWWLTDIKKYRNRQVDLVKYKTSVHRPSLIAVIIITNNTMVTDPRNAKKWNVMLWCHLFEECTWGWKQTIFN